MKDDDSTRVEVTIQCLKGLQTNKNNLTAKNNEQITATVAFTGSATQMDVSSSCLCPLTGKLAVESLPLACSSVDDNKLLSLVWSEDRNEPNSKPLSHLTVQVPQFNPSLPRASLVQSNRGSRMVLKEQPSEEDDDEEQDLASCSTMAANNTLRFKRRILSSSYLDEPPDLTCVRSRSAVWSSSGGAMPEIVELIVAVKVGNENAAALCGTSYLVLFAHEDDIGTSILELPVQPLERTNGCSESSLSISAQTRLRVKIKVFSETLVVHQPTLTAATMASSSSFSSTADDNNNNNISYSKSFLEAQVTPLLEKIRRNEKLAQDFMEAQKNAMDVHVYDDDDHQEGCSSWSWKRVIRAIQQAMSCSGDGGGDFGSGISLGSSIATSDSMAL